MTCCLNPECQQPQNADDAEFCLSCGAKLIPILRGRYRVMRAIGQGGFGKTYLALDSDRLNARCVIKQFSPQVKGTKSLDKAVQLFQQEAERLNELGEHPQIPTLLAYFEHEQRLYLVQQFVEGQTLLQETIQHGYFGERRIREVLVGLLPLLKFVHDHHVIHRDITPSNIIRRASDQKLVLIDFGVAKLLSAEATGQPGTRIGTEGYAPMEQLRGGKAYPASDIYSLAATCIFLMTHVKPDDLYDPMEGRWLWRDRLRQQGGNISNVIAQILDKMLKDLVSERYPSADAVMRDLRSALSRPTAASASSLGIASSQPSHPLFSKPTSSPPSAQSGNAPLSPSTPATPSGQFRSQPGAAVSKPNVSAGRLSAPHSGSQGNRCLYSFTGHSRWVMAVCISPDSQSVISGGLDDAIRIWNLETGSLMQTLKSHTKPVNCLSISPDSRMLASGSDDHTIKLWNLTNGSLLHTLTGHSDNVKSVAFYGVGHLLASGGEDRTARIWQLATGEALRIFSNTAGMIRAVAVSPDSQILASGGLDNQVKLWSLKTGELIRTLPKSHFSAVNAISISPNNKTLISASRDKTIKIWNLATGEVIRTLTGHTDSVNSIALSTDGKTLVSGSSDTKIKLWNVETGDLKATLSDHISGVNAVSISSNGYRIASGSSDNMVKVWQIR
ncbi:protein kinase [Phormidium sp. CLA17]|uniref:WD40 repeat domain-containing serine/threonine-protein kinase n=1 Tax=Leptolyngbya sp. Cla-17 TaxID=2803751 RepID=UPI001492144D|nr:WD40 repeat domain-containing serine/threonine-protein kinase [Leptolyngbya sp. Cla-17]MBM0742520.1 protein kinase [Leptolyngbya sp. Cla-17]